jgi:hypothetical protein
MYEQADARMSPRHWNTPLFGRVSLEIVLVTIYTDGDRFGDALVTGLERWKPWESLDPIRIPLISLAQSYP